MSKSDRALGRGPEGVTYRPPAGREPSLVWKFRTFVWYRFGWGHRPTRPQ